MSDAVIHTGNGNVLTPERLEIQGRFLAWLGLPTGERIPPTMREFAEENDVPMTTLTSWSYHGRVAQEVLQKAFKRGAQYTADVIKTLADRAIDGNMVAIRMFFELYGLMGPQPGITFNNPIFQGPGGAGGGNDRESLLQAREQILSRRNEGSGDDDNGSGPG